MNESPFAGSFRSRDNRVPIYILKNYNISGFFYSAHTLHIVIINTSTKNSFKTLQFITSIKLLHVSAPECHPQGVSNKETR
jgi:hypothetical protein